MRNAALPAVIRHRYRRCSNFKLPQLSLLLSRVTNFSYTWKFIALVGGVVEVYPGKVFITLAKFSGKTVTQACSLGGSKCVCGGSRGSAGRKQLKLLQVRAICTSISPSVGMINVPTMSQLTNKIPLSQSTRAPTHICVSQFLANDDHMKHSGARWSWVRVTGPE